MPTISLPQESPGCDLVAMNAVEKILLLLDETGVDQLELERRAGLARNKISKWKRVFVKGEGSARPPTRKQLASIAAALCVPLSRLVDEAQPLTPPAEAHLAELVAKHGAEKCVKWILIGATALSDGDKVESFVGGGTRRRAKGAG